MKIDHSSFINNIHGYRNLSTKNNISLTKHNFNSRIEFYSHKLNNKISYKFGCYPIQQLQSAKLNISIPSLSILLGLQSLLIKQAEFNPIHVFIQYQEQYKKYLKRKKHKTLKVLMNNKWKKRISSRVQELTKF